MDKYTRAVTSILCPRPSCTAALGEVCKTTAVVHHERRDAALAQGLWDPGKALAGEYGDLAGCPLEALNDLWSRACGRLCQVSGRAGQAGAVGVVFHVAGDGR